MKRPVKIIVEGVADVRFANNHFRDLTKMVGDYLIYFTRLCFFVFNSGRSATRIKVDIFKCMNQPDLFLVLCFIIF